MQNEGKKFEADIKSSVPDDVWYYRLRDGTASWGDKETTRFQQSNICDCQLFYYGLFLLELKSHMGKSLPFTVFKDEHVEALAQALNFGIVAGVVINMREISETYFLYADTIHDFIQSGERKSIPVDFMRERGYRLKAVQKRVRWRYDIKDLIDNIRLDR
jgi:recombination protein U